MASRTRWSLPAILAAALSMTVMAAACSTPAAAPTAAPAKPAASEPTKAPAAAQPTTAAPAAQPTAAGPAAQPTAAAKPAASGEPWKIGGVFAATGTFAGSGGIVQRAIATEIERVNSHGGVNGHPVQFVTYDDQSKPEQTGLLMQKAVQQDKVPVMVGPAGAALGTPNKPVVQQLKIPTIMAGAITITKEENYIYSLVQPVEMGIDVYLDFCKKNGWNKIANIQPTDDLGNRAFAAVNSLAAQKGLTVVSQERYGIQDKDITAQLSKVKAANPDAVISWATGDPAVLVFKNMRQLGMDIPYFPSGGSATNSFFKLTGDVPKEKLMYCIGGKLQVVDTIADSDPLKAGMVEFRNLYAQKFGAPPDNLEATAADTADLAMEALKAVGPDPEKMRTWLETSSMKGFSADYKMSPENHNGIDKNSLLVLMGYPNKWVLVK